MTDSMDIYLETLSLTKSQLMEIKEFIEENNYQDMLEDAISKARMGEYYISQSKILKCEDNICFITNSIAGAVQLSNRTLFEKEALIKILEQAYAHAEVLED